MISWDACTSSLLFCAKYSWDDSPIGHVERVASTSWRNQQCDCRSSICGLSTASFTFPSEPQQLLLFPNPEPFSQGPWSGKRRNRCHQCSRRVWAKISSSIELHLAMELKILWDFTSLHIFATIIVIISSTSCVEHYTPRSRYLKLKRNWRRAGGTLT